MKIMMNPEMQAILRSRALVKLNEDLISSVKDIGWCTLGLHQGIIALDNGDLLTERIQGNLAIMTTIMDELDRRGEDYPT